MKTDVRETEGSYELDIDLPGFKKDEVKLELKDGYLTIQAVKGSGQGRKRTRRANTSVRSVTPALVAAASMSARGSAPRTSAPSLKTVFFRSRCRRQIRRSCPRPQALRSNNRIEAAIPGALQQNCSEGFLLPSGNVLDIPHEDRGDLRAGRVSPAEAAIRPSRSRSAPRPPTPAPHAHSC